MIIDAHAHLWKKQNGIVNGKVVYDIGGGKKIYGFTDLEKPIKIKNMVED